MLFTQAQFQPLKARDLMSYPVQIELETTIAAAQCLLWRYGQSSLSVINSQGDFIGMLSRRDADIAIHYGFGDASVIGHMTVNFKTVSLDTTLPEIQALMATYNLDCLPVLEQGQLRGIITQIDVLRALQHPKYFSTPIPYLELLSQASSQAEKQGWHLYLVGGAVRDLLLATAQDTKIAISDIDLVVDGGDRMAAVGAGVKLAQILEELYPGGKLEIHGAFQTAALSWHQDQILGSLSIDLATARTEFYPYPAANPEVEASSIRQDLYRRDFTINALALRLTPPCSELLDYFGGLPDLQARQIRVLHANSFIEDPTRIYRAVRLAVRLGFEIEPSTAGYIRYAIASGTYHHPAENSPRPALQTRLKTELKYLLQAPYWRAALQLLAELDGLKCIHPTLELDRQVWWQLDLFERCLRRFDFKYLLHWLLRLEVMIAHLKPADRIAVAKNLQLPTDSVERLQSLNRFQSEVTPLPLCHLPSQVVKQLRHYDSVTLTLIALKSPRPIRHQIGQYLQAWAQIQSPLNGNDLKALGYKPGPQFKQILEQLLTATLDGVISDRSTAITFLAKNYSPPPTSL